MTTYTRRWLVGGVAAFVTGLTAGWVRG